MRNTKRTLQDIFALVGVEIRRSPRWRKPGKYWLDKYGIRTVLDIGANEGQFATEIFRRFPKASVHSFEPLEECFEKMNERMAGKKNFSSYPVALGEFDGTITMNMRRSKSASSVLEAGKELIEVFPGVGASTEVPIRVSKLDDVVTNSRST